MSPILALASRELKRVFRTPIAWSAIGLYLVVHGVYFISLLETYSQRSFQAVTQNTPSPLINLTDQVIQPLMMADTFLLILFLPGITMRLMAEEWRSGSSDLLLSYPVRDMDVIVGKFLSVAALLVMMLVMGLIHPLSAAFFGSLEPPTLLVQQFGLILFGLGCLAVGLVFSCLTENQVLAFGLTVAAFFLSWFLGWWGTQLDAPFGPALSYASMVTHVQSLQPGRPAPRRRLLFPGPHCLLPLPVHGRARVPPLGRKELKAHGTRAAKEGRPDRWRAKTTQRRSLRNLSAPVDRGFRSSGGRLRAPRPARGSFLWRTAQSRTSVPPVFWRCWIVPFTSWPFFADLPEQQAHVRSLLNRYRSASANFSYEFVDLDRRPELAELYNVSLNQTLVLTSEGLQIQLRQPEEADLTGGLLRLIMERPPRVLFVTGHGEASVGDESSRGNLRAGPLGGEAEFPGGGVSASWGRADSSR